MGLFTDLVGGAYDVARQPAMQGAAEVAQALFSGNAYVPYGDGQRSTLFAAQEAPAQEAPQHGLPEQATGQEQQAERGGMGR